MSEYHIYLHELLIIKKSFFIIVVASSFPARLGVAPSPITPAHTPVASQTSTKRKKVDEAIEQVQERRVNIGSSFMEMFLMNSQNQAEERREEARVREEIRRDDARIRLEEREALREERLQENTRRERELTIAREEALRREERLERQSAKDREMLFTAMMMLFGNPNKRKNDDDGDDSKKISRIKLKEDDENDS